MICISLLPTHMWICNSPSASGIGSKKGIKISLLQIKNSKTVTSLRLSYGKEHKRDLACRTRFELSEGFVENDSCQRSERLNMQRSLLQARRPLIKSN